MAAGTVIGRVSVKVMPDTKGFRRDAENQLRKIENSMRVQAKVTIDSTQFKSEALKAVRDVNKALRSNSAYKVRFHSTISRMNMPTEVTKAASRMEQIARTQKIKFSVDIAAALVEARLDKAQLRDVKKELQDWRDGVSPLKVMVHPHLVPGGTTWISKRLDHLTRPRSVPIAPFLAPGATAQVATALAALSGARVLGNMFEDIWNSLKRLDKSVPIIGTVAYAVQGLGAFAMAGASNLFALSSSLAQIGPAALALPGIFGGIAIGLGATFAVLKDFNTVLPEVQDKLSALQDRMSANFWSVAEGPIRSLIDTLLPQFSAGLEKASTELGGFFSKFSQGLEGQFNGALGGMFDDLSESIAITAEHTDSFAAILRILGETGAGYLPQLAGWFGDISERFAGFLEQAQGDGSLNKWIDTGIENLMLLGSAIGSVGGILAGLAEAASLGGGAGLQEFADSLDHINKVVNGSTFLSHMVTVLTASNKAMDNISQQAGPAMSSFFQAFAMTLGQTLPIVGSTIGAIGEALFTALANPQVQNAFTGMIAQISVGVDGLLPAIEPLGETFATLMDVIGALAMNLGPVLGAAFGSLAGPVSTIGQALLPIINMLGPILTDTITALTPLFTSIAEKFTEITTAAQPLIERIGELVAFLMPVLVPALQFVADVIGNAVIGVINGAVQAFDGIKTAVEGFKAVFDGIVMMLSGDFSGGIAKVWEGIKGIFSGAFNFIVGAIKVWLNVGILSFVKGGITKLVTLWKGGWKTIQSAVTSVWNAIKTVVSGAWNAIKANVTASLSAIGGVFKAGWNVLVNALKAVWNLMTGNVSASWAAIKQMFSSAIAVIKGVWSAGWNAIVGILKAAWNLAKGAVKAGTDAVLSIVKGIPGKIKGALSGAGTMLVNIGENIVRGLGDGIESMKQWVIDKIKALADLVPGWVKKRLGIKSPSRVLKTLGKYVGQGFALGIAGEQGHVNSVMSELMGLVEKTANKAAKALVETTHKALTPMAAQFEQLSTSIETAKGALEDKIEAANDYAKAIRSAVNALGDLTKMEGKEDENGDKMAVRFADLRDGLTAALKDAKDFSWMWRDLRDLGLNGIALEQFMDAGVTGDSLAAMKALLEGGVTGIQEVNQLQAELDEVAKNIGQSARHEFHQAGIDTARGFLEGLQTEQAALVTAMQGLASALVVALKAELGIKSPSRVFKALGGYVTQGLALGVGDGSPVTAAMSSLGSDMADSGKAMIDSLIDGMESRYGAVQDSLEGMALDPQIGGASAGLSSSVGTALSPDGTAVHVEQKVLNYHAAPGSSLGSEEDLFAAAGRGRMVGW